VIGAAVASPSLMASGSASRRTGASRLNPVPFHQLAGDDDLLQLVGALADDEEGSVAVVALDVELLGISIGAVDAHGFERVLHRRFRGRVLGHTGLHVAAAALVVGGGGIVGQRDGSL